MLASCSSNDNANNTMNVDQNLSTVDMNATDMNAVDMNAADNVAESNATASVEKGVGAFVQPPPMEVGSWAKVEFLVAPKEKGPGDLSGGTLEGEAQGKPLAAPGTVFIAAQMRVTLSSDPNVRITAQSKDVQPTGLDKSATWQWNVMPLTSGEHELSAQVDPLDSKGNARDSYTRYVTVHATATIGQRAKQSAESATTAGDIVAKLMRSWEGALLALAALIGALFLVIRTVKNRGSDSPSPPDGEKHDG
jgi:hypothetical protein